MTRDEFCRLHWAYYMVLERDFLATERYLSFDLGDNYAYDSHVPKDVANSQTFSNEFVKQYQAICSEVDVILKTICRELGNATAKNMPEYTCEVLGKWSDIPEQKVKMNRIELQPFKNWEGKPNYNSPVWWTAYNNVKHDRLVNFKDANLKNVVNALAGLYVLELYLVRFIGERDKVMDVPNDVSKLFEIANFETINEVIGFNSYLATNDDIDNLFK